MAGASGSSPSSSHPSHSPAAYEPRAGRHHNAPAGPITETPARSADKRTGGAGPGALELPNESPPQVRHLVLHTLVRTPEHPARQARAPEATALGVTVSG